MRAHRAGVQPVRVLHGPQALEEAAAVEAVVAGLPASVGQGVGQAGQGAWEEDGEGEVPVRRDHAALAEGAVQQVHGIVGVAGVPGVVAARLPLVAEVVEDGVLHGFAAPADQLERHVLQRDPGARPVEVERPALADDLLGGGKVLQPGGALFLPQRAPLGGVIGLGVDPVEGSGGGVLLAGLRIHPHPAVRDAEGAVVGGGDHPPALGQRLEGRRGPSERHRPRPGQLERPADEVVAEHDAGFRCRASDARSVLPRHLNTETGHLFPGDLMRGHVVVRNPPLVVVGPPLQAAPFAAQPDVGVEGADGHLRALAAGVEDRPQPPRLPSRQQHGGEGAEVGPRPDADQALRHVIGHGVLDAEPLDGHRPAVLRRVSQLDAHHAVLLHPADARKGQPRALGPTFEAHTPVLGVGDDGRPRGDHRPAAAGRHHEARRRGQHRPALRGDRRRQPERVEGILAAPDRVAGRRGGRVGGETRAPRLPRRPDRLERRQHPFAVPRVPAPPVGEGGRLVQLAKRARARAEGPAVLERKTGRHLVGAGGKPLQFKQCAVVPGDRLGDLTRGQHLAAALVSDLVDQGPDSIRIRQHVAVAHDLQQTADRVELGREGERVRVGVGDRLQPRVVAPNLEVGRVRKQRRFALCHAQREAPVLHIVGQFFTEGVDRLARRRDVECLVSDDTAGHIEVQRHLRRGLRRVVQLQRHGRRAVGGEVGQRVHGHLHRGRGLDQRGQRLALGREVAADAGDARLHPSDHRQVVDAEHQPPGVARAVLADQLEIRERERGFEFPPDAAVGGSAGRRDARRGPHPRLPVLHDLPDHQPGVGAAVPQATEVELELRGVVLVADVAAHRLEQALQPVVVAVGAVGDAAAAQPRPVAGPQVDPAAHIQVFCVPRQEERRRPRIEQVRADVNGAADCHRLAPLGRVQRAIKPRHRRHPRHGKRALIPGLQPGRRRRHTRGRRQGKPHHRRRAPPRFPAHEMILHDLPSHVGDSFPPIRPAGRGPPESGGVAPPPAPVASRLPCAAGGRACLEPSLGV
ncbi:MAG: hypothetical protein BWZ02_00519 [Lentisphaerae bacterium ADurb.BinA184]|nr:MAG: hypothetical protein BWZ02_00519 [Lentisphaerae bacterium ADurb.BinA184]